METPQLVGKIFVQLNYVDVQQSTQKRVYMYNKRQIAVLCAADLFKMA